MPHVGARPTDVLTLRSATIDAATADWRGVARVDGAPVTISTTRDDPTVTVEGLPEVIDVRIVDGSGTAVDRPVRRA